MRTCIDDLRERFAGKRTPKEEAVTERTCDCAWPDRCARNPAIPILYDAEMNEYHVAYGPEGRGRLRMRHCPWCGGALPESRRGSFFTEPDPAEVSEVERLMSGVRDIPTMRRVLGEPDAIHDWSPLHDEAWAFHGDEPAPWKRQFTYWSTWRTLQLAVHEADDGSVKTWSIGGQPRRKV
jgi:uncharacterized protein DUF6980